MARRFTGSLGRAPPRFDYLGVIGFNTNFDLFAYSLLSSFALLHYYYDAFIWKVRRPEVQQGL